MKTTKIIFRLYCIIVLVFAIGNNAAGQNVGDVVYADGNVRLVLVDGGWQVLHGDNVVAYGNSRVDLNNMPPAFKNFLDSYAEMPVRKNLSKSISKSEETEDYGPYITTAWDQSDPYNIEFPTVLGTRVLAGCVTISSAQVINYYRHCNPINIEGIYMSSNQIQSPYLEELNTILRWQYRYKISYTPNFDKIAVSNDERSKYLFYISLLQNAEYGVEGTSTLTADQVKALQNYFGYYCDVYELQDEKNMYSCIHQAITEGHPVIVEGMDEYYRSHSYIIDGFYYARNIANGWFHVNYGWGGLYDGWYSGLGELNYGQINTAVVAYPSDGTRAKMQPNPKYLCLRGKGEKTFSKYGLESNVTGHFTTLQLKEGAYDFYFEYPDGSTIAPTILYNKPLGHTNNSLKSFGRKYHRGFTEITLENDCSVYFSHSYSEDEDGSIWLFASGYEESYADVHEVTLHTDGKAITMNYDEGTNAYWTIMDVEPGLFSYYFTDNETDQIYGIASEGAYIPTIGYGDNTEAASFYCGDSPVSVNVLDYAKEYRVQTPVKTAKIKISCINSLTFKCEIIGFAAQDDTQNCMVSLSADKPEHGAVFGGGLQAKKAWTTICARPNQGWVFNGWSDGYCGNPRAVYLEGDTSLTAQFVKVNTEPAARELRLIQVAVHPKKMKYKANEPLDTEGCVIYGYYTDNTIDTIAVEELNFSSIDPQSVGKQSIVVEYNGKTTTFDVVVTDKTVSISEEITAADNIRIWSFEKTIFIENATREIVVVDMLGRIVRNTRTTADHIEIPIQAPGIYIVKTGVKTQKVLIR